ncbi:hypothetical protein AKJ65_05050 [candidate division MSBL1 archaeon SCGC-AAA259E19]|uniref:AdoMet activation domain-containing protein n=1 Tax=candidate division MSBL1 archaeon SCGC-AAA259E19 TaxID=1698264 RepID=A0A133UJ32_9EURY|nr:hypothetical protein AKJ65_05050 [candidate division MSBL1 archaeon SCGC-AAA259E19]
MEMLKNFSTDFDRQSLLERVHLGGGSDRKGEFEELVSVAESVASPKGVYKVSYITGRSREQVELDGVEFESRVLAKNLEGIERVFPYVVTCGNELDEIEVSKDSYLTSYWLENIKGRALEIVSNKLQEEVENKYGLEKTGVMNPGSADREVWPIEQQKGLFSLFGDLKKLIGVELTEGFQIVPKKSASGIIFPTELDYVNCRLCRREDCSFREADFDPQLAEEYGL